MRLVQLAELDEDDRQSLCVLGAFLTRKRLHALAGNPP
jgi:hypothetical protein